MAGTAAVEATGVLPDFPGDPLPVAKPKRVRKPRAKSPSPPTAERERPILHLKSSTARRKAPEIPVDDTSASEPAATDGETFELTAASGPSSAAESATRRQIEIPELPAPSPGVAEAEPELNGASQEANPAPIAAAEEEGASADTPALTERAGVNGSSGDLPVEPQVQNDIPAAATVRVPATAEVEEQPADLAPEPAIRDREIERPADLAPEPPGPDREIEQPAAPEVFEDPRFTYVPRWRDPAFANGQSQEDFAERRPPEPAAGADSPEPRQTEATQREQVVPAPTPVAPPRKVSRVSLRTQLILIALAPILVGGAIAFFAALLSPTLFAARSEIVVNVTSMDWSSAERFLATQLVVVKARSTLQPISQATGIPLRDLEKNVRAELIGSSDVISIQYANSDASRALDVVKAVTAQYLINLRDYEQVGNGRHRVLMPATLLDEPVSLKPLYAALIGGVAGFAIGVLGLVLRTQLWRLK